MNEKKDRFLGHSVYLKLMLEISRLKDEIVGKCLTLRGRLFQRDKPWSFTGTRQGLWSVMSMGSPMKSLNARDEDRTRDLQHSNQQIHC